MPHTRTLPLLAALTLSIPALAQTRAVVDASTVLLVPSDEPEPIQRAAQDLASDMEKVFGKKPRIVQSPEAGAPLTILIGQQSVQVSQLRPAVSSQLTSSR